jgi:hypothetical protein
VTTTIASTVLSLLEMTSQTAVARVVVADEGDMAALFVLVVAGAVGMIV